MKTDIFKNNLESLANELLLAQDDAEVTRINSKIEMISNLISQLDGKTSSKPKTKPKAIKHNNDEKKHYDISDVVGLSYGQAVKWQYRQYGNDRGVIAEQLAIGEFLGVVAFQMNGFQTLGIAIKCQKDCLNLIKGRIYGFKLESIRGFSLVE